MYFITGSSQTELGIYIGSWYQQKIQDNIYPPYSCIGFLDKKGELRGAALFNNYNKHNIDIHLYTPKCFTKNNIRAVYRYAFLDLKCSRLTAIVKQNSIMDELLSKKSLSFKFESLLDSYFGKDIHAKIYYLTPELASKWIK